MAIFNEFVVSDKISTSGQPTVDEFTGIAASGHEVVINLAMPDHEKSIANEGELVSKLGMSYFHIPVPFDAPSESDYALFCACMNALEERRVWIHCIVNARVSAFLYRYLQEHRGYSETEATTPILEVWRRDMDGVWSDFVGRA